jgi:glycosyltransferase involved in cell wall biosynthesis
MTKPVICTIVAKNYLAHARCLTDSFLAHHPEGHVFVLLVDELDDCFDPAQERFTTVLAREIGIPDFRQMLFRYTVIELSTAVKPYFLEYLFRQYDCRKLCYFDPDIYFYAPIDEIFDLLDSNGILLLPHLTGFLDDQFQPDELFILQAGAYNLGFIGLSQHPELSRLLGWWQDKLLKHCTVDLARGLFVDQRWMDLVPGLFSSVHIHRDPGCDVAYWNLNHRPITLTESGPTVNGLPLKFFHFSGFSPDNVQQISKHQNRYTLDDLEHLKSLFYGYRDCLLASGYEDVRHWPYAYDCFDNGIRIPEFARYLWREVDGDGRRWPDPYLTNVEDSFLSWLNEPVDNAPAYQPTITQLALEIYRWREDAQQAFRDVLGQDRWAFAEWLIGRMERDYGIDSLFLEPIAGSLERAAKARIWRIARFPSQVRRNWGKKLYLGATGLLMRTGVGPYIQRTLGESLVSRVRNSFFSMGSSPVRSPQSVSALPPRSVVRQAQLGLNVIGYFRDETGVGQAARAVLKALYQQGFPVAYTLVSSYNARKEDTSVLHLPRGNPHHVNLFHVNADEVPIVYDELGPEFFADKYNIGYWFWELACFPNEWLDRFKFFDELWVGTSFVQTALSRVSPIPVVNMGIPVGLRVSSDLTRVDLGLPEDKFMFLFVFDMLSIFERKNPLGLVEAYRRAFEPHFGETTLVIKVTNLDQFPEYEHLLRDAVKSVSGVLIDRYVSREELSGLYNLCNAYVSLHRSEGFGVTIAEAMSLGKPAIATDYSANEDFMTLANSYPVAYRLVELNRDYVPYRKGQVWADPDLDHAAAQMRRVFENPEEAARKGTRAAVDIQRLYSDEVIAQRAIKRLEHLAASRD